jgi:FKBP-type peptidyl-prolyl cis-trans isomerase
MLPRLLVFALAMTALTACHDGGRRRDTSPPDNARSAAVPAVTELIVKDLVDGAGEALASGQSASVHYTGWLYAPDEPGQKGRPFDSSRTRGQPFTFAVGSHRVIKGWDQGVVGMKVGGQRRLIIPSSLGYGARGAGGGLIPPNATLLFDVELVAIK